MGEKHYLSFVTQLMQLSIFEEFWRKGLLMYDEVKGINWKWLSIDGAMAKSPLGGEATGANPTDRAKKGLKEVYSQRRAEFRSPLKSLEQIKTISNSLGRHLKIFK
jgi:hypothetical protein